MENMQNNRKYHILVEYSDGSFQWIRNSTEQEVAKKPGVKRIRSYCNVNFAVDTKRWKTGKTQFQKIILD